MVYRQTKPRSSRTTKSESQEDRIDSPEVKEEPKEEEKEEVKDEPKLTATVDAEAPTLVKDKSGEDYLWMYEIDWKSGRPYFDVSGVKYTPPVAKSKRAIMKAHLLAQPRIRVLVQLAEGESDKVFQSVCLNGYRLDFPKADYLELPLQIADLLTKTNKKVNSALKNFRIDRDAETDNALT